MNWKKLLSIGALTMFSASIATGQGTAPTIVQGDYISNVFGNSNFIKNPNAKLNNKDVTVSNATVTRSTTTPLVATSEFLVTTSTATGSATWSTRTFDGGMKGQNCEARFSYRGFSVGSTTAQILQGANVVAQLTLTPSTDPRIASINFPCGDLSSATTFRLQQATASLTGTNEIGGIYVGLATNMANVAQAEFVGQSGYGYSGDLSFETVSNTYADLISNQTLGAGVVENQGNASSLAPTAGVTPLQTTIANPKPGNYYVTFSGVLRHDNTGVAGNCAFRITPVVNGVMDVGGPDQAVIYTNNTGQTELSIGGNASLAYQLTSTPATLSFKLMGKLTTGGGACRARLENSGSGTGATRMKFTVHRFPLASELVVTPERQNVFGGVKWSGNTDFIKTSATSDQVVNTTNFGTVTTFGKANVASTTCSLATNDIGMCLQNVPPGIYEITSNLEFGSRYGDGTPGSAVCSAHLDVAGTSLSSTRTASALATAQVSGTEDWTMLGSGIVKIDSLQTNLSVVLKVSKDSAPGGCRVRSQTSSGANAALPTITFKPVDQPSNSALYVQGPVLGAQTGAAIPEGYVNEWSTRSVTDSSSRTQGGPVATTWYYPWSGTLTLPAGNWQICYRVLPQLSQASSSTNSAFLQTKLANNTDADAEVFGNGTFPNLDAALTNFGTSHYGCGNVAITTSKTYRVGIRYLNNNGTPSVNSVTIRGDVVKSELFATRLN